MGIRSHSHLSFRKEGGENFLFCQSFNGIVHPALVVKSEIIRKYILIHSYKGSNKFECLAMPGTPVIYSQKSTSNYQPEATGVEKDLIDNTFCLHY